MRSATIALATIVIAATATAAQDAPMRTPPAAVPGGIWMSPPIVVPAPVAVATPAAGPSIANVGVAYAPVARPAAAPAPQRRTAQQKRGTTLMIVGGAMLIGGIVIGDDAGTLVALGGLAVGIYGLYLFVQ